MQQTAIPQVRNYVNAWHTTYNCLELTSKPTSTALSNPNALLSQKLCHYLNQDRTLNYILMSAAHWITYFDLSKLTSA